MRVHFHPLSGKESRCSYLTSRGGGLNLNLERNSRGRATIPKKTLMLQFTSDTPDSPALTGQLPRGSTQNTMAVVTALWCLERKPPIPMVNPTGKMTLLFQLKRTADLHVSTRDEALTLLWMPGGTPRSMPALERKREVLASNSDEDLGISTDWRGIPRCSSQLAWRLDFLEATRAVP